MKRREQITGIVLLLTFAWVVAFWAYVWTLPEQPHHQRPTINRPLPATIEREPPTIDARYVASSIVRDHKTYHLPNCSYVPLIRHRWEFATEQDAITAGYEPCSRCLTPQIARVK